MSTVNKAILIGHLGDNPKLHYFEGGGCIGRFSIATNEKWTNKQTGELQGRTDWHNIVVRNKGAETCEKYLSKGDKIYIEGKIQTRKWTDDNGPERYTTEINCDSFKFLTPKSESQPQQNQSAVDTYMKNQKPLEPEMDDDDLPF